MDQIPNDKERRKAERGSDRRVFDRIHSVERRTEVNETDISGLKDRMTNTENNVFTLSLANKDIRELLLPPLRKIGDWIDTHDAEKRRDEYRLSLVIFVSVLLGTVGAVMLMKSML